MEDLQDVLQSILSDPEQMARVTALAESLGLKPPETPPRGENPGNSAGESGEGFAPPAAQAEGPALPDPGRLMGLLTAAGGGEARVLTALRPVLDPNGRSCVDRALRAARLSRLAASLLSQRGAEGV